MELMIVVVIMSVVVAMIVPRLEPSTASQLTAAGGIVVADLDYARHLAVANGSRYQVAFDAAAQSYTITHTGTNSELDSLPASPFRRPGDPADKHIGRFADFPQAAVQLRFHALSPAGSGAVEFGSYGELSGSVDTTVWLRATSGPSDYYLPIQINAVTGLATLGQMQSADPTGSKEAAADSGAVAPATP